MKKENYLYTAFIIILCLLFVLIGRERGVITPPSYLEIMFLLILLGRNVSQEITSFSRINILILFVIVITKYMTLM